MQITKIMQIVLIKETNKLYMYKLINLYHTNCGSTYKIINRILRVEDHD